jgi:hypothetical protein
MATATVATQLPSADDEYLAARREWRDRYSDLADAVSLPTTSGIPASWLGPNG